MLEMAGQRTLPSDPDARMSPSLVVKSPTFSWQYGHSFSNLPSSFFAKPRRIAADCNFASASASSDTSAPRDSRQEHQTVSMSGFFLAMTHMASAFLYWRSGRV